ncbi:MAG: hypothetical protein KatS3mg111_2110 [Pirellulaceae bacterium]|nr:MAG: hypothetical protein KatS3mg111_2110 [Pirellulaceae bacterium]
MIRRLVMLLFPLFLSVAHLAHSQEVRKIVFLAGKPSHGYGAHEHLAGCRILADTIERAMGRAVECVVLSNGWPADESILDDADTIVMYCDGGDRHPALPHLETLGKQMDRGAGFVCLHYAVEVPKDKAGAEFLRWLGGYFETHWSVNPHWTAQYIELPEHPITRGVPPFSANDEWYFHMRFPQDMQGVTPILSAVPPPETMRRPDGPHSGNPTVRKEVAEGRPQITAWAFARPNGGRSFGFTGGHVHWNWGRPEMLRLVGNAIVWTAHLPVPEQGLAIDAPAVGELAEGQDEPTPPQLNLEDIAKQFQLRK